MKIVVAIDTLESARSAVRYLIDEKHEASTQVHLVHVLVPGFADVAVQGIPNVVAEERRKELMLLSEMAKALHDTLGITATVEIAAGEIAEVVAAVCKREQADAVIVPSHARHGFSRLWFGSVAQEILEAAPCTAIILKLPAAHR